MSTTTGKELGVAYATAGDVYAAAIVLPILGIIFLAIRMHQRRWQREGIRIDDWLMVPSLVCAFIICYSLMEMDLTSVSLLTAFYDWNGNYTMYR